MTVIERERSPTGGPRGREERPRGRFAPSPSGRLHFGSLVAALGSFMSARARGGSWLVRMEDIDPPREEPGAAGAILRALERHALEWDGEVLYQSRRGAAYEEALERLRQGGLLYACGCTRREIEAEMPRGPGGPVYTGRCRDGVRAGRAGRALRVRAEGGEVAFEDRLQGRYALHLERQVGDFVVRRADGLYAYQLAVVVDDAAQGITEVVRGCDLIDATPRQLLLQRLLALPTPAYLHLPVALAADGRKLSKQNGAPPLDEGRPAATLAAAWAFLGQRPPPTEVVAAGAAAFVAWGVEAWREERLPR